VTNDPGSPAATADSAQIDLNEHEFVSTPLHHEVDPDHPPWGILAAFLTWLFSVALLLFPQLMALPYVAVHYQDQRPTIEMLLADKTFILIIVIGIIPVHLLTLGVAWAVATRLGRFSVTRVFGLSWPTNFRLWQSVALALLLFGLAWLISALFGGQDTDLERILRSSRAAALITAFIAVATAPLVEEVIYRGLLYSALQHLFGKVIAVIAVASAFAGLHVLQYWPNVAAISSIALLSVVLTLVRARTGRLLPSFVIHMAFNGIQSIIIVAEPYVRTLMDSYSHKSATGALYFLLPLFRSWFI
jgi:membrane protease YdiL (CAAX protease family)